MDVSEIGRVAAALMDDLEEDLDGNEVEIGVVALIVEITGERTTEIRYRCSDRRQWIQRAILREALELAEMPDDEVDREDP